MKKGFEPVGDFSLLSLPGFIPWLTVQLNVVGTHLADSHIPGSLLASLFLRVLSKRYICRKQCSLPPGLLNCQRRKVADANTLVFAMHTLANEKRFHPTVRHIEAQRGVLFVFEAGNSCAWCIEFFDCIHCEVDA